jgi:hypothetical protein
MIDNRGRRRLALVLAPLLVMALALVGEAPAAAAPAPSAQQRAALAELQQRIDATAAAADNFARDCAAGNFCAYDGSNYSVLKLLTSSYSGSSNVDVANNRTASAANKTDNNWCGWNDGTITNTRLYNFAPHTGVTTLGSANDKIDFFRARAC